jgi:hypothetical protein
VSIEQAVRRALAALAALAVREADRCRLELDGLRSDWGWSMSPRCAAAGWSVAAVAWGNGVVVVGRVVGGDQWITLSSVPGFGFLGWWWLWRKGFRRQAIGVRLPRADGARALTGAMWAAVGFVGVCSSVGLARFGHDMRGLRTIRTVLGTAFGEELSHRGVLLVLWANAGVSAGVVLVANVVVFAAWHVAGAWHVSGPGCGRFHPGDLFGPGVGAVLAVWLRLRFRSVFAPMAFHAATNIMGVFKAAGTRC